MKYRDLAHESHPLLRSALESLLLLWWRPSNATLAVTNGKTYSMELVGARKRASLTRCDLFAAGLGAYALISTSLHAPAQGTTTFNFDGPPIQPRGTSYTVQRYQEAGMLFTPINPSAPWAGFGRCGGGIAGFPENGTAYLQAAMTDTLKFAFEEGSVFDLRGVDLAGYSDVVPDAVVHFIGYRHDGSTVAADLAVSGLRFQTFSFGPEFRGLDRVEIPTYGYSLDNLVVIVPEPGTGALLASGLLLWLFRSRPAMQIRTSGRGPPRACGLVRLRLH